MCEIFPEVETCCLLVDLRVGMLLISVFCVMTGVLGLCIVEQRTDCNFEKLKNVTRINSPTSALSSLGTTIPSGLSAMSVVFIFTGIVLLFATLTDQEGFAQIFVWMTFLNVLVGYVLVLAVAFQCVFKDVCLLSDMDWLSGSAFLVLVIGYLSLWIYFIAVVNSYVTS